jgi:peptide deformylase
MSNRTLVYYGDPILRERCEPVTEIDDFIIELNKDLRRLLVECEGVGFAANQAGAAVRMFVWHYAGLVRTAINPVFNTMGDFVVAQEGCLSLPGTYSKVPTPSAIDMTYTDIDGIVHNVDARGYEAQVLSHEMGHLDGQLFIDRLNRDSRRKLLRQVQLPEPHNNK